MRGGVLRPLLLVLALLVLTACQKSSGVLFYDRFGNPNSGWGSESREAYDRGYQEGEYFIEVYEPDWFVWAGPGKRFGDVVVTVDAAGSPALATSASSVATGRRLTSTTSPSPTTATTPLYGSEIAIPKCSAARASCRCPTSPPARPSTDSAPSAGGSAFNFS